MASQNLKRLLMSNNPVTLALSKSLTPAFRKYATKALRNPVLRKQTEEAKFLKNNPIKPLPVATVLVYLAFVPYPIYCIIETLIHGDE